MTTETTTPATRNVRVLYASGARGLGYGWVPNDPPASALDHRLVGNSRVPASLGYEEAADLVFWSFNRDDLASRVSDRIRAGLLPGVTHSSMSVGDAVRFDDGTLLVCAPFGWEVLRSAEQAAAQGIVS